MARKYQSIPDQPNQESPVELGDPLAGSDDDDDDDDAPVSCAASTAPIREVSVDDAIDLLGMGRFQYRILIAAGLCFAADAMEVLLLSFLTIILQEEWDLTDDETAFITSILFAGALVGTSILGPLADKWGRRPVFILAASIIALFGIGTSLAQNYIMMLVIMFIIGFGVGGLTVPFDTLAEFLPAEGRGTNLLLIEYFWTFGCLLVIVFAELTLAHGKRNWRLFVILCSLPCFVSIIMGYLFVPESVRWLVSEGRNEEALTILREAARMNQSVETNGLPQDHGMNITEDSDDNTPLDGINTIFPLNILLTSDENHSAEDAASCADLMKPQWRRIILLLWGAWGGFGLGYYGAILSVTKVFDTESSENLPSINGTIQILDNATIAADEVIQETNEFDYSAIFISSSAELLGTTLVIVLVDRVGRIPSQVVGYAAAGACIFLLCALASIESSTGANDRWELVTFGFILRAMDMAATCTSWVMTAEVLPTEIRSTGHSSANAVARLGAFFSPFIVDTLSLRTLGIVMLLVHWFTALCVSQLPETKGAHMGGGISYEHDPIVENENFHGGSSEDNSDAPSPGVNNEAPAEPDDGLFVIDSDDDEDISAPTAHGIGPEIHLIPSFGETSDNSVELI